MKNILVLNKNIVVNNIITEDDFVLEKNMIDITELVNNHDKESNLPGIYWKYEKGQWIEPNWDEVFPKPKEPTKQELLDKLKEIQDQLINMT